MKYLLLLLAAIAASGQPPPSLAAQKLEGELRVSPDDLILRQQLMEIYRAQQDTRALAPHVFWVIENHADSPLAQSESMQLPAGSPEYDRAKLLWEDQASRNPSVPVLRNAAHFLSEEPAQALELLKRASRLEPKNSEVSRELARAYGALLAPDQSETLQRFLRDELSASRDPVLLGAVAQILQNRPGRVDTPENDFAGFLMSRAKELQPDIERRLRPSSRIRVEAKAQAEKLRNAPQPEIPPSARESGAEGTVRFNAVIGVDGNVIQADAISGNPLLADAAKKAVLGYQYEPTVVDGTPVEVLTTIEVVFRKAR